MPEPQNVILGVWHFDARQYVAFHFHLCGINLRIAKSAR
jgi:hypothetical protein